jgi:hypothetical protein
VILTFDLVVLATTTTFGQTPGCNGNALVLFFGPFHAQKSGHILGSIIVALMVTAYSIMTARDYTLKISQKRREREQPRDEAVSPRPIATDHASTYFISPQNTTTVQRQVRTFSVSQTPPMIDF